MHYNLFLLIINIVDFKLKNTIDCTIYKNLNNNMKNNDLYAYRCVVWQSLYSSKLLKFKPSSNLQRLWSRGNTKSMISLGGYV